MKVLLFVALALSLSGWNHSAVAADTPCGAPNFHAFDYTIGSWVGRNHKGDIRGKLQVQSVLRGCSIRMHWIGRTFEGTSNNTYDASRGVWQKAWFDDTGGVELSVGRLRLNDLVYVGEEFAAGHRTGFHRESWLRMPDGRIHQRYELSKDGKNWTTAFDTYYSPIDSADFKKLVILRQQ